MKKSVFAVLMFLWVVFCGFAEENTYANRNTALKYLKLAQDYVLKSQWNNVLSIAEIGLTYDSSLADLWYVKSIAQSQKNEKPYIIIENLENALQKEWVSYNPSGAKIMLANYYYNVVDYEKSLNLLSDRSLTLNSDALKTSAKIYYQTGNLQKARETINTAWRMFPLDVDFPLIFYKFENPAQLSMEATNSSDEMFFELNKTFLSLGFDYVNGKNQVNPQFLLLASSFADSDMQNRLLKVYKTQGIESPLYPLKAFEAGLISEDEAISSFFALSKDNIDFNLLNQLFELMPEEKYISIYSILDSFQGTLFFDNNEDGFYELTCQYKNGRPFYAEYEAKQDGIVNWTSKFDYGAAKEVYLPQENFTLRYEPYPYLSTVEFENVDYNFIPESISWLPFDVKLADFSSEEYGFYILNPVDTSFDSSNLYEKSSSVVTYLSNKNQYGEDKVKFSLSNGKFVSGNYYLDGNLYASAVFENGLLIFRNVDKDLNGSFEITEVYKNDSNDDTIDFYSLFGSFEYGDNLRLSNILVDINEDGEADYFENYNLDGSFSKKWDVVQENRDKDNILTSLIFDIPLSENTVEINFIDEKPVNFLYKNLIYPLMYDSENDFYWLGDIPSYAEELDYQKIKQDLIEKNTVYSVQIYKMDNNNYFYAVKTFDFYFAQLM